MKHKDSDELLKELKNKYTLMSKYYRKFGYDFMRIFMHHDINLENIIKHNLFCEPEKTEEYFVFFENEILITWKLKREFIYVYENLKEEKTMDYKDFEDGESVNQFGLDDKAIFQFFNKQVEVKIVGFDGDDYVIKLGKGKYMPAAIGQLSKPKKPDELEKGNKFKDYSGNTVEVLARENSAVNVVYYFGRTNSENIDTWTHHDVDKIIYD